MLRRVLRVFRIGLLLLGLALLAWWPLSWLFGIDLTVPFGNEADSAGWLLLEYGQAKAAILPESWQYELYYEPFTLELQIHRLTFGPFVEWSSPWVPTLTRDLGFAVLTVPLWLLAAVCLAWPVTSFLLRRRGRGRGFEVEAKDGGAVSTADS